MARQVTALRPTVVLTRPARQADEFAEALGNIDATVIVSPVLKIQPISDPKEPSPDEALILTSRNGISIANQNWGLKNRRGFVVGHRSGQYARDLGLDVLGVAESASEMPDTILRTAAVGPLVHMHGKHVSGEIVGKLRAGGVNARELVIYDQVSIPLSDPVHKALSEDKDLIFPLFSRRTALIIGQELSGTRIKAKLHLVSISAAVDGAWDGPVAASRCHADTADATAMMKTIRDVVTRLA